MDSLVAASFSDQGHATSVYEVYGSEIVTPKPSACVHIKADGTIREELDGFLYMKAFNFLLAISFPVIANVVGNRIVLEINDKQTR